MEGYSAGAGRGGRGGRGRPNQPRHSGPASTQYDRRDHERQQGRGSRPGYGRGDEAPRTSVGFPTNSSGRDAELQQYGGAGRGSHPGTGRDGESPRTSMGSPAISGGRGAEHQSAPVPNPNPWSYVVSHGRSQDAGPGQAQYRPAAAHRCGRGGGAAQPQPQPHPQYRPASQLPPSTDTVDIATATDQLGAMAISQPLQLAGQKHGELVPMKRPDQGQNPSASSPWRISLLVNHFPVQFNPSMVILHYDVAVKPEARPREAALVMEQLLSVHLASRPLAYDGQKNIYSAVSLPAAIEVKVSKEEGRAPRTYDVTLQLVNELSLSSVLEFLSGSRPVVPREVFQGLDVIMKENMRRSRLPIGGSFYSEGMGRDVDIGRGVVASMGVNQSLKPTSQGLVLCLDYCVNPFRKGVHVMQFLEENLNIRFDPRRGLSPYEQKKVEAALKKLKVTVTHRRTYQKFVVVGLTREEAKAIRFPMEVENNTGAPRMMPLLQYYREAYGKEVAYKLLPCLDLSKNQKPNYVPMELCELVGWQRFPKDHLDRDQNNELKRLALARPADRKAHICEMVQAEDGPSRGGIIENFNISVDTKMTRVIGRQLNTPVLKIRDQRGRHCKMIPQENGQWNLTKDKVFEGSIIDRWAIIDFLYDRQPPTQLDPFINSLAQRCIRLGVNMRGAPLFKKVCRMDALDNPNELSNMLHEIRDQAEGKLQILICIMSERHSGYKTLKRISEIEVGIITQCCLRNPAIRPNNDQYLANLALKINAKLGGATVALFNDLPCLPTNKGVMFIGADVNHPKSYDAVSHSIAAVVGTINWPGANKYATRFRIQDHRKEKIQNLGEMCLEIINVYTQANGNKPEKIILFRDGVSESQFDMVLNEELMDVKKAINLNGYSPTITLVVAQKRHQTRIFPESSNGNVPPGTVVDTIIVRPQQFDFYLCSHNGILGTSKPTHYHVIRDENRFTTAQLQEIFYNLCYTFARCTKPISLVPPVYYADLVAYRVRFYYESLVETSTPSDSSSSSRGSSLSPLDTDELVKYLKLHTDVENQMFFC